MGLIEPNDGTLRMVPKPGEVRNPRGVNSHKNTVRNRKISELFTVELDKPCDIEGYEDWTQIQYIIHVAVLQAMAGDPAARKTVLDRRFGRVPFTVEMDVSVQTQLQQELEQLSDEELALRMEVMARSIRKRINEEKARPEALDAVVVEDPSAVGLLPPEGVTQ
jgi:hypothetical protein